MGWGDWAKAHLKEEVAVKHNLGQRRDLSKKRARPNKPDEGEQQPIVPPQKANVNATASAAFSQSASSYDSSRRNLPRSMSEMEECPVRETANTLTVQDVKVAMSYLRQSTSSAGLFGSKFGRASLRAKLGLKRRMNYIYCF